MKNTSPSNPQIINLPLGKARKKMKDPAFARLWAKSGGRCEFRGCNCKLYEDNLTQENNHHGQIAHIIAFSPDGPRGDKELSELLDGKDSNAMLMCGQHHHLIDHEEVEKYTVEVLRGMNAEHEENMQYLQGLMVAERSMAIVYFAKTSNHFPPIQPHEIRAAILHNGYFPSMEQAINLTGGDTSNSDTDDDYWIQENRRLDREFNTKIQSAFGITSDAYRWAIFAIAPQPLLVKLGAKIGNLQRVDVYQRHRQPVETWQWPIGGIKDEAVIIEPSTTDNGQPALILAFSADAIIGNVKHQYPELQHWIVKANNPSYHWCNSKDQQNEFKAKVGIVLNKIKEKCPGQDIHLFLAVPASLAVEFGRIWMPKADATLQIYDINQKTKLYNKVLKIEN